jgi:hypothetical protein
MATIEDALGLNGLSEMSDDDLRELLQTVRHNRTTEDTIIQKVAKKKASTQLTELIDKMSPEQLAALRALMED